MKIISKPDFESWKKEVICKNCTSVLEIDANDLQYLQYEIIPGARPCESSMEIFKVICTVCRELIYIPSSDLSKGLIALIKQKNMPKSTSTW